MKQSGIRSALLLGTASLFQLIPATAPRAQDVTQNGPLAQAQSEPLPEQVLVTGSLIHGTAAVGVPVTNFGPQDYVQTGALTTAELFRTVPAANVSPAGSATTGGGKAERATRVNLRGLDRGAVHELLMVDGVRIPPQGDGLCIIDPSFIPELALDRVDILPDGASATYGSDAVSGVINIILKRAYDGAVTQLRFSDSASNNPGYAASQLWGRTWDGGDIALTYEWTYQNPVHASEHSKYTVNYTPWGLNDRRPIGGSLPGTVSIGAPSSNIGTGCTNCYAIPAGAGQNFASNLNSGLGPLSSGQVPVMAWSTLLANGGTNGTQNIISTYADAWETTREQRNGAVITVDQRLMDGVSLFGSGFYSNRRNDILLPADQSTGSSQALTSIAIPTSNPYYPSGAPANLRVNYDIAHELHTLLDAYELAGRYLAGLNLELPRAWEGKVYYSNTFDNNANHVGSLNVNALSAALGWTINAAPAGGTAPGIASYTKPATVPYLNLFCDPRQFGCNSPATLAYVTGERDIRETYDVTETGAVFDGALFDLPAGPIKAAVGGTYEDIHYNFTSFNNGSTPSLLTVPTQDPRVRTIWAGFAQVNVPVIGDANSLPLVRRLEIEGSWRHDQYSDVGGTSNPKLSANWLVSNELGLGFKGSWGTSFRAPNFAETSGEGGLQVNGYNLPPAVYTGGTSSPVVIACNGAAPSAGSVAADLFATGVPCNATPGGVNISGGSVAAARLRITGLNGGPTIHPEEATNWSAGFELAPTTILQGLDVQATWYSIKINGVLDALGNANTNNFNSASNRFMYILPSNLGCPVADNANPALCAPFEAMVGSVITDPQSRVSQAGLSQIYWIEDNGVTNLGWRKLQGIDWTASYDIDLGDFGAWNTGIVGTYYLHDYVLSNPALAGVSGSVVDLYHQTIASVGGVPQVGVETLPRMNYRARLGWSDGTWTATGFANYNSHFFAPQAAPPNVNFQCASAGGTAGGGTFPCAISNYTNIEPSYYTFDLSLGYMTGDSPANSYLRNIGVQLVIQNLLDSHPPFEYRTSSQAGQPAAFDITKSDFGRIVSVTVTKTW